MNPSVNRLSESSKSSGLQPPEAQNASTQPPGEPKDSPETTPSNATQASDTNTNRQHPIPPPSDPKQYRAIGLVLGQYKPSQEQLTRGELVATDGTSLQAVLLGRVISLVKNHIDLEDSHVWVVYPRTRQKEEGLHVQLVGVWSPETLNSNQTETESESATSQSLPEIKDGYFSIRGEAIFYSKDNQKVVIKIQQAPRSNDPKPKFFKLELKGILPSERPMGHFWDLQVQLQGSDLVIEQATDVGIIPLKKRKNFKGGRGGPRGGPRGGARRSPGGRRKPFPSAPRGVKKERPVTLKRSGQTPLPKPTKRKPRKIEE